MGLTVKQVRDQTFLIYVHDVRRSYVYFSLVTLQGVDLLEVYGERIKYLFENLAVVLKM